MSCLRRHYRWLCVSGTSSHGLPGSYKLQAGSLTALRPSAKELFPQRNSGVTWIPLALCLT